MRRALLFSLAIVLLNACTWSPSEEAEFATFSKDGNVFIDGFSGGLEYLPFAGSKLSAFQVDTDVKYDGEASMRFDVPNGDDPDGNYAGAIFPDNGGRNLTEFDALTFWARANQATTIDGLGFGNSFGENKYLVTKSNLRLSTVWQQFVIPIPDASKLTREKGLFWYSTGAKPQGPDGEGYTFWIDELKFEKLGTVAQPRPAILNGEDLVEQSFTNSTLPITGLTQTFNLANGQDQTVEVTPGYFSFSSSNSGVATVNAAGVVTVLGSGTAVITATLGGVAASGSLTIESQGAFQGAPTPTRPAANVISVFSDAYTNIPVDFYNGYWAPFQTTLGGADLNFGGDNLIRYTELNFVGTEFKNPTVNASGMTHFHVDLFTSENISAADFIRIELGDFGPDDAFGGGNDSAGSFTVGSDGLSTNQWISLDIPLTSFGLASTRNMAQIIFVTEGTISELLVDNMYFYSE